MEVKTKYSIGDTVWYMKDNRIHKGKISKINNTITSTVTSNLGWYQKTTYHLFNYFSFKPKQEYQEHELYPTKEELIKSL